MEDQNLNEYFLATIGDLPDWINIDNNIKALKELEQDGYDYVILEQFRNNKLIKHIFSGEDHKTDIADFICLKTEQGSFDSIWIFHQTKNCEDSGKHIRKPTWIGGSLRVFVKDPDEINEKIIWYRDRI